MTPDDLDKAIELLKQAAEECPTLTEAAEIDTAIMILRGVQRRNA